MPGKLMKKTFSSHCGCGHVAFSVLAFAISIVCHSGRAPFHSFVCTRYPRDGHEKCEKRMKGTSSTKFIKYKKDLHSVSRMHCDCVYIELGRRDGGGLWWFACFTWFQRTNCIVLRSACAMLYTSIDYMKQW